MMRRETPLVGLREWFLQAETGRSRVLMAVATGAVVAFVVAWFAPWQLTVLVGWDVVAVSIVGTVWLAIVPFTPDETRDFAQREDSTRAQTHFLLLGASLVSLVGVVLAFLKANNGTHQNEIWLEGTGIATIASSWLLVHTVFMLRYAHLYYTLEALSRDDLVAKAFETIASRHQMMVGGSDEETFKLQQDFAASNGVSADDFAKAYNSFSVNSNLQRATEITQRYQVQGVPFIIVNGKYTTDIAMAGGEAKLIESTSNPSSAFKATVIATTSTCNGRIGEVAIVSRGSLFMFLSGTPYGTRAIV